MSASQIVVNQGTSAPIATDLVGTVNYGVVKLDIGTPGNSTPFAGTIPQVTTIGTVLGIGGTVAVSGASAGTFVNLSSGTLNAGTINAGTVSVNTPGTITSGSIAVTAGTIASVGTVPGVGVITTVTNLSNGTIQNSGTVTGVGVVTALTSGTVAVSAGTINTIGTITNLANGTIQNSGTVTGVGVVSNITNGSIVVTAGTVVNNGGTVAQLTGGSITVTAGTITNSGTTTGVGVVTSLTNGSIAVTAGTVVNNGGSVNVQVNPLPVTNTILHVGSVGTAAAGTLVGTAAIGAGTALYPTHYSIVTISGTPEVCLSFGTQTTGNQVIIHGLFPAGGGIVEPIIYPHGYGTTASPLTFQILSGSGTVAWDVNYFLHT